MEMATTTTTTTLTSLPEEILLEITKEVCCCCSEKGNGKGNNGGGGFNSYYYCYYLSRTNHHHHRRHPAATLRLINRRFARISRPFLFRHLEASRMAAYLRLHESQPDIAGLTQTVSISGPIGGSSTQSLLPLLTNLKTLHISRASLAAPMAALPTLQTLHCTDVTFSTVLQLLQAAPHLKTARIAKCAAPAAADDDDDDDDEDEREEVFSAARPNASLRSMTLLSPQLGDHELQRLLRAAPRLEALHYHSLSDEFHGLAFGRALQHLHGTLRTLEVSVDRWYPARHALGSLRAFGALRALKMDYCWLVDEALRGEGSLGRILPAAAAPLQCLALSFYGDGVGAVGAFLRDLLAVVEERRCCGLRRVEVTGFRIRELQARTLWAACEAACAQARVALVYDELAFAHAADMPW